MDREKDLQQFEQYLQRRFPNRRTAKDYGSDVRQFMGSCPKDWRGVDLHDIDAFVNQQQTQGLKQTTVNRRVAALKTFFDFLAEDSGDLSWPNPVRFKRHAGKRTRSLPRDLRDEDLERVWSVIASARDRAWFVLMVRAGLRVGEVVALKLDDLLTPPQGEKPARLRVCGKGRKERLILLSADAYAVLATWLAERPASPQAHVFLNERGKVLAANGIEWLLHGYGRQAGVDLTPHQLRHTFARQVTEAGMPITSLGKLLGHSQITTTQIYTAGADPELAKAYQAAMSHLGNRMCGSSSPPVSSSLPTPAPVPVSLPEPKEPDWEAWEKDLPPAFRQVSLEYVQRSYPTWKPRTRRNRAMNTLNELSHLWGWLRTHRSITSPGQIGQQDVCAYQSDQQAQGYAAGTINRRTDYVLGIIRLLADREEPVDNSVFRLRYLRRPDSLPKHLTEDESQRLEAFLQADSPPSRSLASCLLVMLHSGLRSGECVELRRRDLDLAGKRLIVRQGKGGRDRLVYLSDPACQALQAYLQDTPRSPTDCVWISAHHRPLSQAGLQHQVAKVGKALGIEHLYPHRLRHTCATRLLNVGMDITRIQKLLGHEMISTTLIYARVQDATVENDFRQALQKIELRQTPLSSLPVPVDFGTTQIVNVHATLDDSV